MNINQTNEVPELAVPEPVATEKPDVGKPEPVDPDVSAYLKQSVWKKLTHDTWNCKY